MGRTLCAKVASIANAGLLLATLGCNDWQDRLGGAEPPRPMSHAAPAVAPEASRDSPLERASREAAFALAVAERRLAREVGRPDSLKELRCPDEVLRERGDPPLLHLRTHDSRADRRQLLPLDLLDRMAPDELAPIRSHFAEPEDELAAPVYRRVRSLEDAAHVQQQLAELASRPFLAVAHVINYTEPRLTLKANARRREWIPGVLDAMLVIYDAGDDEAMCQIRVTLRNDVTDAPIRVRLRSDTREQLKHRLGEQWRSRAARELEQISSFLELPPQSPGRPTEG